MTSGLLVVTVSLQAAVRAEAIFLVPLFMCPCLSPDIQLSTAWVSGCGGGSPGLRGAPEGTEVGVEAGQRRAEAQDVRHELLDGLFGECHAQVWEGCSWCLAPEGPK